MPTPTPTPAPAPTPSTASGTTFNTAYYSITIPPSWEGLYEYEKEGDNLYFYERESYRYGDYGGFLFGICLEPDDTYLETPGFMELGALCEVYSEDHAPLFEYYVMVEFPTDVQAIDSAAETYARMSEDIEDILSTFTTLDLYMLLQ